MLDLILDNAQRKDGEKIIYLAQGSIDTYSHNDLYFTAMAEACALYDIALCPVNLGSEGWQDKILAYARDEGVLFFFGLNGFGNDLSIFRDSQMPVSVFEFADKPYLTSFSDPPFISEMWDHTRANFRGKIYIYTDHSYLSLAKLFQNKEDSQDIYFYPGFCPTSDRKEAEISKSEKEIDTLFAATLIDPEIYYQNFLNSCQKELVIARRIFEEIVETFLLNLRTDCLDWINQAFVRNGLLFDLQIDWHRNLLDCVSGYIKFSRRKIILENLKEVPLTIMTREIPYQIPTHRDTVVIPPVPFQEFQKTLGKTKICLCPTPHYRGFHERVISAMYENCLVLSTPNQVLEQEFVHGKSILFFQDLHQDLLENIEACHNDSDRVEKICWQAQKIALEKFSARQAVEKFLNIFHNYRCREKRLGIKAIEYDIQKIAGRSFPEETPGGKLVRRMEAEVQDVPERVTERWENTMLEQRRELEKLNTLIESMQNSPFWNLEKTLRKFKKSIGLDR